MIRSMTGFGRGSSRHAGGSIIVEIKTVNHKFFDLTARLPSHLCVFEDKIKEIMQRRVSRGKVNLSLVYDGVLDKKERVDINEPLAKSYYHALTKLGKALGTDGPVMVKDLILLPGVINYEAEEASIVSLWPKIKESLEAALARLVADRKREGAALHRDLAKRARLITRMLTAITRRATLNVEEYRRRFAQRVKELSGAHKIDAGRLEMEVAIFAKNSDISEELTRLQNHIANFKTTIGRDAEAGKKLDFIAQELHREINTVGSKASDFKVSKSVIEIKSEIEKIREQVKNVE